MSEFTEEQRAYLDKFAQAVQEGEAQQASEIISGCHNKFQFAKTYRVLRKDFHRTNQQMRDRAKAGNVGEGVTPEVLEEMIRIGTAAWERKMERLATHFRLTWHEPIQNYAGKDDGSSCVGLLFLIFVPLLALVCS